MSDQECAVAPRQAMPAPAVNWRRNLYILWVVEFLSIAGFQAVLPFLPFYVEQLGVRGTGQIELWTGYLYSVQAIAMGIMGPIWGSMGDRVGRKAMVLRATIGGAILLALMGMVTNVYQLLFLRLIQGAVTGTVSAASALVAASTPPRERAHSLGTLQMGVFMGMSFGPTIGGLIADWLGYRASFFVTGILLGLSALLLWSMVQDVPVETRARPSMLRCMGIILHAPGMISAFSVRLLTRTAYRIAMPMVTLFVPLIVPAENNIASLVGIVTGIGAAGSAIACVMTGRFAARFGVKRVLGIASILCAVTYFLSAMSHTIPMLIVWQAIAGVGMGGVIATMDASLAEHAPEGMHGAVYGLDTTVQSIANAIGPMIGSWIAAARDARISLASSSIGYLAAVGLLIGEAVIEGSRSVHGDLPSRE